MLYKAGTRCNSITLSALPGVTILGQQVEHQFFFRQSCGTQAYVHALAPPLFFFVNNHRQLLAIIIALVHRRIGW